MRSTSKPTTSRRPGSILQVSLPNGVCRAAPGPTSKQFLTAQAHGILAVDFVHIDTAAPHLCLIIIEYGTRRAHLAGITAHPDGTWATQAARNFLMDLGHRADAVRFLICDRAGQLTDTFDWPPHAYRFSSARHKHRRRMPSASR